MATANDTLATANAAVASIRKKKKGGLPNPVGTGNNPNNPHLPTDDGRDPNKPNTTGPSDQPGFPGRYDPNKPKTIDSNPDKTDGPDRRKPKKPKKPKPKPGDTNDLSITAGMPDPNNPGEINIADYASNLVTNPSLGFTQDDPSTPNINESMSMEDHLTSQHDVNDMTRAGLINGNSRDLQMDADKLNVTPQNVDNVDEKDSQGYDVATTANQVAGQDMHGAKGTINNNDLVHAAQIDIGKIAEGAGLDGSNPDGAVGQALAKYAAVNMSNIIDTSTSAGKLLAQQLGDGNYVDSKATLQGQLEVLQSQFVDPVTGEAKIPSWAAGTARNVSKIAAFKGMSGTAATAAMSQALLEASIPIAQADSQFFQTLTLQNLDNRQQSVINTANTLAKFEQTNVDNRMAAAIQNAKNFMDMDMANLSNDQQARVINTQQRVQSILADANAKNAERLFQAQDQTDRDKFYDSLNTQINQYNSSQNLDAQKFNSTLEDSREKFYKEMQYNIDVANAKWRQEVQLNEDQQQFQAATMDVKNMTDLSVNQLNQIWDRSDALLDYAWKSSESDLNRKNELAKIALSGKYSSDSQMMESLGLLAGTFVGSSVGQKLLSGLFGF